MDDYSLNCIYRYKHFFIEYLSYILSQFYIFTAMDDYSLNCIYNVNYLF